jgi:hypothetical protein
MQLLRVQGVRPLQTGHGNHGCDRPIRGQCLKRGQGGRGESGVHAGLRAVQTYFPCLFTACEKAVWRSVATSSAIRVSINPASFFSPNPKRMQTRRTWVSTIIPGRPKQAERTRFAVFRPTPGSSSKPSMEFGTFPSKRPIMTEEASTRCLAFVWKKPTLWMIFSTSEIDATDIAVASGQRENKAGVTLLT